MDLYQLLKAPLFQLEGETSHQLGLTLLGLGEKLKLLGLLATQTQSTPKELMGLTFKNPIGLAAGLDKNGEYIDAFARLGFGFIEIGTVTPKAQSGNPKPRLFRLQQQQAIINRMGFNNKGIDYLIEQVKKSHYQGILGINIGKNLSTSLENANQDYLYCFERAYPHASYITVNLSSPNTPGLRHLQFGEALKALLTPLKEAQHKLAQTYGYKPLVVKIAPDMNQQEVQSIADSLIALEIDGVIATNTTLARDCISNSPLAKEAGGLSGAPLTNQAQQVCVWLQQALQGRIALIGVGGIQSASDAKQRLQAGADLLQLYTGFIYQGPKLIADCLQAIEK